MSAEPVFVNQAEVADRWRGQIATVKREREALRAAGGGSGKLSALTRRINAMEEQLSKLLSRGASHE